MSATAAHALQGNDGLAESGIHFEFRKGRFPLRFALLAGLMLFVAIGFSNGADWLHTTRVTEFTSYSILVCVFVAVSVLILWPLNGLLAGLHPVAGALISWVVIVSVAVFIAYLLHTWHGHWSWDAWGINSHYLTPQVGTALVTMAVVFTPLLLWLEKRLYADRASQQDYESRQFSNLDFRIRPHFLFNTLNSVAGLISIHPKRAETALFNLADVFRVVLADKRQLVPLKAELDLADKYLYLEKTRLGERLKVVSRIDPNAVGIKVPILLLQPLLENSVYHGIETRFKGGTISINIQLVDNDLVIKITNPLPEAGIQRKSGNRVAQQNLRERIKQAFGDHASLDTYEAENTYNVIVRLPL